jgi:hypothetical protein
MPTTLTGLLIFVGLLTPGLLHYIQRRALSDQPQVSVLVEAGSLTTVSLVTNLTAIALFSLVRWQLPSHTPDVGMLFRIGNRYVAPRPGYLLAWGALLLAVSSTMAIVWARRPGVLARVPSITPDLIDTSAWIHEFEAAPGGSWVYVGCELADGSFVGGYLDWYNTNLDEAPDRDIALAAPIKVRSDGNESDSEFSRVILSARNITTLYVSYLTVPPAGHLADSATHPSPSP